MEANVLTFSERQFSFHLSKNIFPTIYLG